MTSYSLRWKKNIANVSALLVLVMLTGVLFACRTPVMTNPHEIISGKTTRNVPYGRLPRQVMDVAIPENTDAQTPWVLMVHGGGWRYGNKRWMAGIQKMLYQNDIASVNINYRLAGNTSGYREQMEDVDLAALKMKEIMLRSGNNGKYFLLGESAGGHLSLLYGYQHPEAVVSIISLSGPTDFYTESYRNGRFFKSSRSIVEQITGGHFDSPADAAIFEQASPVAHVAPVPTLLFHGAKDRVVDSSQGLTLARELARKNVPYKLVLMPGAGHVPRLLPWKRPAIYREILEWIQQYASETCFPVS